MKYIVILICFIVLVALGGAIYFASQISAVYPPIKEYKYPISEPELRLAITKTLDNQDIFEYYFSDTVGSEKNGYAYYVDLKIKGQLIDNNYIFKFYDKQKFLSNAIVSKIDLIYAFDKIYNTGGYKIKDKDVSRLVRVFEVEFIDNLMSEKTKK